MSFNPKFHLSIDLKALEERLKKGEKLTDKEQQQYESLKKELEIQSKNESKPKESAPGKNPGPFPHV